jgi:hypothetical protein
MDEEFYLVRRPSGNAIHTSTCRHAKDGGRWVWADKHPDTDWKVTAPWLKPCGICKPPSPLKGDTDA